MKNRSVFRNALHIPEYKWIRSLRTRVLIASVLLFGLMIGAVVFNSIRVIKGSMVEYVRVSAQQTSEILNLAAAPFAISGELETLKAFLDELLSQENEQFGLVYLVIWREDGVLLLKSGLLAEPAPEPDTPETYPTAIDRGIVHIRKPLLLENNEVGFMQYGLSFNLMVSTIQRLNREGILLAIGGLTVVSSVVLFIMLKIVRRINMLAIVSRAIAQGNFERRASETGRDEISLLAANFNRMADAIQQRVQEITRLNKDLESRVEARTLDLVKLNQTLQHTIEDLKWTQENLIRSEKLAGLGALVAGVAHELNTPIGNALTVATTLQDHTRDINKEFQDGLRRTTLENFLEETRIAGDLIVRNLHRAANLVTSFKHVAVDQTSENRREFDLCTTVEEIVATLSPMLKKTSYRLEQHIPKGIILNSYPGAIGQIIANLVNNAVIHGFENRDHGTMTLSAKLENQQVKLEFSDDGIGMSTETLNRLFDPFFTTRLGQGGSGLGMSIVHGLVCTLLSGSIDVESSPGQGTRYTIFLPVSVAGG